MKLIGFVIILVYWNSLSYQFSMGALGWLVFGILLCAGGEILQYLGRTERYIHRDRR
jgi:hypothetical protein